MDEMRFGGGRSSSGKPVGKVPHLQVNDLPSLGVTEYTGGVVGGEGDDSVGLSIE